jgi:hypothetical protein
MCFVIKLTDECLRSFRYATACGQFSAFGEDFVFGLTYSHIGWLRARCVYSQIRLAGNNLGSVRFSLSLQPLFATVPGSVLTSMLAWS